MTFYVTWLPWSTMWRKRPCEPISSTTKSTLSGWTPFSLRYCPCLCWYTWIPQQSLLSTKWANLPTFPVAVNGRPILFKGLSKKEVDSECANKTFDYFEKTNFSFQVPKFLGKAWKFRCNVIMKGLPILPKGPPCWRIEDGDPQRSMKFRRLSKIYYHLTVWDFTKNIFTF